MEGKELPPGMMRIAVKKSVPIPHPVTYKKERYLLAPDAVVPQDFGEALIKTHPDHYFRTAGPVPADGYKFREDYKKQRFEELIASLTDTQKAQLYELGQQVKTGTSPIERLREANAQLQSADQESAKLRKEIDQAWQERDRQVKDLREQIGQRETEIDELKKGAEQTAKDRSQVKELRTELDDREREIDALKKAVETMKKEIEKPAAGDKTGKK